MGKAFEEIKAGLQDAIDWAKLNHIDTEEEYQAAVDRISELMNAEEGSPEIEELKLLVHLTGVYAEKNLIKELSEEGLLSS